MDSVSEIKSRLPIEDLVGQYCQLTKKGRNFVCLCPFHHDKRPSMLVSPDKGIAYCFPCQKGGDIFSFYQLIEGVDFRQALKDLAEKAGVTVDEKQFTHSVNKDEKDRARSCLEAALSLYQNALSHAPETKAYLHSRGVTDAEIGTFELGLAPDSFSHTYEALLKQDFSQSELLAAGLAIRRDLGDGKVFDRFRNRLMFPIRDVQGRLIGFGGRTLGNDDAKYMNSPDSPLYHKSLVLFGLPQAKQAMRDAKEVLIVEGYFDVLACHRMGFVNVLATCGTALTPEHASFLRRHVETVLLCLDQDRAGREAAERAFGLLSKEGIAVRAMVLPDKDPADAAVSDPEGLKQLLAARGTPYLEYAFAEIGRSELLDPIDRRHALERVLTLLGSLTTAVERTHYLPLAAAALHTTESALEEDLAAYNRKQRPVAPPAEIELSDKQLFSALELALGLFLLHPSCRSLLGELLPPDEEAPSILFQALKQAADGEVDVDMLPLTLEQRERIRILQLFCEQHGFGEWNESMAAREIRKNCQNANHDSLHRKQKQITEKLVKAKQAGSTEDESALRSEFMELLKLAKSAK